MATWRSPTRRPFRDASPSSPLTPLSPSALPQWLISGRSRPGLLTNARLKTVGLVLGVMLLGWMSTTVLGPRQDPLAEFDVEPYDMSSSGVLTEPSGYGLPPDDTTKQELEVEKAGAANKPSLTGALSELHHAVSDKIQSWNPYQSRPSGHDGKANTTKPVKGKKKPAANSTFSSALGGELVQDGITEEARLGARTRIGKCTILFHGNSFWERSIRTHEQHDRLHGYRLHVLRQQLMDDVWSKPAYMLTLLLREMTKPESERLEWLFWVDADTIILNPYIPIEVFLPPPGPEFEDVHLMYSNDWNGLNNGVFPVRVNQWSVQLFSAIVSYRHFKPEDPLVFRDQSAMNSLMQDPKFAKGVVQVPQRWFNAYQGEHNETLAPFQIRRGDLLVHFAGVGNREERMGYWLERAEQHLDDWEIPVKSTSYPQEAKDFWQEQREARKNRKTTLTDVRLKATQLLTKTDDRLAEYGDRLSEDQRATITEHEASLKTLLQDEKWQDDVPKVHDLSAKLEEASYTLTAVVADANKRLLNAAHEAIFAAEKDLLVSGYSDGVDSPELVKVSVAVKALKNLVMAPDDMWNKADITAATNAVTEARAALQEKAASLAALVQAAQLEKVKTEQAQTERAKQLEEAKRLAFLEAGISVPDGPSTLKVEVVTVVPVAAVVEHVVTVTPAPVMVWTTAVEVQAEPTNRVEGGR